MTTTDLITADELLQMKDDGFRYELVRGELIKMSPAGHQHGRIALNLTGPLFQHVKTHNLGAVYAAETGFKLAEDPDVVRAPDAAFIRRERVEAVGLTDRLLARCPRPSGRSHLTRRYLRRGPGQDRRLARRWHPLGRGRQSKHPNGRPALLAERHPYPDH